MATSHPRQGDPAPELDASALRNVLYRASHDLRQPLQSLALLQGVLETLPGEKAQKLSLRLDNALGAMSNILDTMLDINRTDAVLPPEQSWHGAPQKSSELSAIQQTSPTCPATSPRFSKAPMIFVVDDASDVRAGIRDLLEAEGCLVEDFATCESFLATYRPGQEACLLIDAYLPGMQGLELMQRLNDAGHKIPTIMITGRSDVPIAVQAMKSGASDFIEKPFSPAALLTSIDRALEQSHASAANKLAAWNEEAANRVAGLTPRQQQIMELVLAGHPSKNIAADLGISRRTVESHRASIMKKTGSKSLPALTRLALGADPEMTTIIPKVNGLQ